MLNARELEYSESPNPADDSQYIAKSPSPDFISSSFISLNLQSVEDNGSNSKVRRSAWLPGKGKSRSSANLQGESQSSADLQEKSRSSADLQGKSRSSADLQGKSRPSADLQGKSRPSADLQGKSRPSADLQGKSRPSADLQGKSRSPADLQGKSRSAGQKSSIAYLSPLIDANELFFQARSRLYHLEYLRILNYIELLYDNEHTLDETLGGVERSIFKGDLKGDRDLFLSFQELLTSKQNSSAVNDNSPPRYEGTEFYPWTRDRLDYDQFVAFLAVIRLTQRSGNASLTFDGLLSLSPIPSVREKFYDSAKLHLSAEQFRKFVDAIKMLIFDRGAEKTSVSSVLLDVENIFGTDNKELFLSFQELVNLQLNDPIISGRLH